MNSSPIQQIKDKLDIIEVIGSYIKLKKAGANYRALCPFHSEKTPSFFVSPARQIWHCFGCNSGGDVFGFIKQIEGVEFGDALRILAQRAGVELRREDPKIKTQRQRIYEICELSCRFFEKQLRESSIGKAVQDYLLKRGLTNESIAKWRLGYAPNDWQALSDFLVSKGYTRQEVLKAGLAIKSQKDQKYFDRFRSRIIFPVFDLNSQVVGFGGRIFQTEDPAKYLNTPNTLLYDKSRILYGLDKAKLAIRKKDICILVEGYIDVILSHQAGFGNIVATSGTALSSFQLKILKRYSEDLLTAFDMDSAGSSATKKGIDLALAEGFNIKVVQLPEGADPADVISKKLAGWGELLKGAKSILEFYFENALSQSDPKTAEGRRKISKALLPVIKRIPSKIEQSFWTQKLANTLGVEEIAVNEELKRVKGFQNEMEKEEKVELPKKSRKDLLEERLIELALRSAGFLKRLKENDFSFFSPRASQVLNCFNSVISSKQNVPETGIWLSKEELDLPSELSNLVNYLSLRAESKEDQDLEIEFKNCLKGIKSLVIKEKLGNISKKIRTAESENNLLKAQKLLEEFNHHSKELYNLEGKA